MQTPNHFQEAVIADTREGKGHTFVRARAGTGKTTTIVQALHAVPRGYRSLLVAFNRSIAEELKSRAPASAEVKTLHGYGLAAVKRAMKAEIDEDRSARIARELFPSASASHRRAIGSIVSKAKNTLAQGGAALDAIIDDFQIDIGDDPSPRHRATVVAHASTLLARSAEQDGTIDFDDMIWFPHVHKLSVWQYDRVFIDEAQDLNAAQISLALKAAKKIGRITAVGDDRQAIYGFRGADRHAVDRIVSQLNAKTLPLSVTYRCAQSIVSLAKQTVPDFECGRAFAGTVADRSLDELKRDATAGDFVLSRTNAPLVRLAMGFMKEGKRIAIQGRDLADGLLSLIRKMKAESVSDLLGKVQGWCDGEVERLAKLERDPQATLDRAECIYAVSEGARSVAEIKGKITAVFADGDNTSKITLSSTHRAKGLERNRVWLLSNTYRPSQSTEEANLWYVAITRAKDVLYTVEYK